MSRCEPHRTTPSRRAEPPSPVPAASASRDLGSADALFTQKKYEQAGKIYADLAMHGRLPSARKKVWAYCRWAAVVARVNAHPRSAKEWDAIEKEIQSIQVLTPGNWYGEYLKDRVNAAHQGERPPKRSGGLVVRGAAPTNPKNLSICRPRLNPPRPVQRRGWERRRRFPPRRPRPGKSMKPPASGSTMRTRPSPRRPPKPPKPFEPVKGRVGEARPFKARGRLNATSIFTRPRRISPG